MMRHRYEIAYPLDWTMSVMFDWVDWLTDNVPSKDWSLDYSMNYNRILFKEQEDATAFKLRFGL
jgi:hypothetical protein